MRQFTFGIFVLILMVAVLVPEEPPVQAATEAEKYYERERRKLQVSMEADARKFIAKMVFIKDEKTGLCFGYSWGGMANGGPMLVTVPCDKVGL